MKRIHSPIPLAAALLWTLAPAYGAPKARNESPAASAEATFEQIDDWASAVSDAAFHLNDMALRQDDSDAHLYGLEVVRGDINRIGRDLAVLEAERDSLTECEVKALDLVLPLMREAAADAQNAIALFNSGRSHLWATKYVADTAGISKDAHQAAEILHDSLQLQRTQEKVSQMEHDLGEPSQR